MDWVSCVPDLWLRGDGTDTLIAIWWVKSISNTEWWPTGAQLSLTQYVGFSHTHRHTHVMLYGVDYSSHTSCRWSHLTGHAWAVLDLVPIVCVCVWVCVRSWHARLIKNVSFTSPLSVLISLPLHAILDFACIPHYSTSQNSLYAHIHIYIFVF